MDKSFLFKQGLAAMARFCNLNNIDEPTVTVVDCTKFGTCAYYRPNPARIVISLKQCAHASFAETGRAWSFPGHMIDRTPFGVLSHELGHHIDHLTSPSGSWQGNWSKILVKQTGEPPISGYSPNSGEWFAEMFRLFLTNPNLLKLVRPKVYQAIAEKYKPLETRSWDVVLSTAPTRVKNVLQNRIIAECQRA